MTAEDVAFSYNDANDAITPSSIHGQAGDFAPIIRGLTPTGAYSVRMDFTLYYAGMPTRLIGPFCQAAGLVSKKVFDKLGIDGMRETFIGTGPFHMVKSGFLVELLRARDIALEASRAKSDFLASMSHEIRTPLNAIIGMGELLSETQLNSEQLEYLRVFRTAGDSLLNTINDILDLSKLEAGQVILDGVEFDLRALVENTVEVLGVGAHEKGLKLSCHFAPDVPTMLVGDPVRLGPVITNLLDNAIKFTEKGEVAVHVENDPEANSPGVLRFRVCDTGTGIPPDKLDVIFESFVQADPSITREYGGTGLGLTISRRLIELMGGRIWVESTLGKGSIFHFTARFEMPDQANTSGLNGGSAQNLPPVASSGTSEARALRILLVEDSRDNRMLVQAYLKNTPHQIDIAENGEIAVRKFVAGNYDLVLMDMQMPVMDGYTATKAIRKWESKQGVRPTAITALTAYALMEEVQKSLDAGCTAHISKPIKKAQLFEAIYEHTSVGVRP